MAEIWGLLVVEFDRELPLPIRVGGRNVAPENSARVALPPRTIAGFLRLPWVSAAVHYTLDSYGQETTIVYCGLRSFREIQSYWQQRTEVYRNFGARYSFNDRELHALLHRLDHTVYPLTFDVESFSRERGVTETVRAFACR